MSNSSPLGSLAVYSRFVAALLNRSTVEGSTLAVWSVGPYPNDSDLASTYPHHKHVPPDIKHHRVPAPGIYFDRPNLPALIAEIERRLVGE